MYQDAVRAASRFPIFTPALASSRPTSVNVDICSDQLSSFVRGWESTPRHDRNRAIASPATHGAQADPIHLRILNHPSLN